MEQQPNSATPLKATCHCGAITLTVPNKPQEINDCQCTICRRYGAAWAYYNAKDVTIDIETGSTAKQYVWGTRQISFNFCDTCGCMCYWYPFATDRHERHEGGCTMGVNTRMMDPAELRDVNRVISNDAIFEPVGRKEAAHAEDRARY